jgi:hypothetical protein
MIPKSPKPSGRTSFGRVVSDDGVVTWRLFRKSSVDRRLFQQEVTARDRRAAACALWRSRRDLRDRVDDYDLRLMGLRVPNVEMFECARMT